jgi:hypothetical protein
MPIGKAFRPQIVLVSCGFDGTEGHPAELGGYKLSPPCFGYMTKKLMGLADGRLVLALEGGYDKASLADCAEVCLQALAHKRMPALSDHTLRASPNSVAVSDLERVIDVQSERIATFTSIRLGREIEKEKILGRKNVGTSKKFFF